MENKRTFKKQQISVVGKNLLKWFSNYKKPSGSVWKRYFNKQVRHLKIELS